MSIRPQSTPLAWILVGAATLFAGVANAQEGELTAGVPPNFPIAEFQTRDQTARWLLRYDWAAWKSSDEVYKLPAEELRKVLGPEWYCSDSERTWDCYYGKYDPAAGRYLPRVPPAVEERSRVRSRVDTAAIRRSHGIRTRPPPEPNLGATGVQERRIQVQRLHSSNGGRRDSRSGTFQADNPTGRSSTAARCV